MSETKSPKMECLDVMMDVAKSLNAQLGELLERYPVCEDTTMGWVMFYMTFSEGGNLAKIRTLLENEASRMKTKATP